MNEPPQPHSTREDAALAFDVDAVCFVALGRLNTGLLAMATAAAIVEATAAFAFFLDASGVEEFAFEAGFAAGRGLANWAALALALALAHAAVLASLARRFAGARRKRQ
jgi:hypothetical protein